MDQDLAKGNFVILNMEGKILQMEHSLQKKNKLDISSLPSGNYLLEVKTDSGIFQKSFVKE